MFQQVFSFNQYKIMFDHQNTRFDNCTEQIGKFESIYPFNLHNFKCEG